MSIASSTIQTGLGSSSACALCMVFPVPVPALFKDKVPLVCLSLTLTSLTSNTLLLTCTYLCRCFLVNVEIMSSIWCPDDAYFVVYFEFDDNIDCVKRKDIKFSDDQSDSENGGDEGENTSPASVTVFYKTHDLNEEGLGVVVQKPYKGTIIISGGES